MIQRISVPGSVYEQGVTPGTSIPRGTRSTQHAQQLARADTDLTPRAGITDDRHGGRSPFTVESTLTFLP